MDPEKYTPVQEVPSMDPGPKSLSFQWTQKRRTPVQEVPLAPRLLSKFMRSNLDALTPEPDPCPPTYVFRSVWLNQLSMNVATALETLPGWNELLAHVKQYQRHDCDCHLYVRNWLKWRDMFPVCKEVQGLGTWLWHRISERGTWSWICIPLS